ncbi:MAG: hypothetical protein ACLRZ7_05065, partial [Lachnospiraceae bacterium]
RWCERTEIQLMNFLLLDFTDSLFQLYVSWTWNIGIALIRLLGRWWREIMHTGYDVYIKI